MYRFDLIAALSCVKFSSAKASFVLFFLQFSVKPQQNVCYLGGKKNPLCGGQGLLPVSGWDVSCTNLPGKAKLNVRINITVGLHSC